MAGDLGRTDRAAGDHSAGNRHERDSGRGASALLLAVRLVGREADLRRRIGQRLESRAGAGAAGAGHLAARRDAADGDRLEPGRPDLFLHAAEHQSQIRRDGIEVARRLGGGEELQVRAERGGCGQLRRSDARVPGAHRSGQADRLRPQHRPGGAATGEQQRQRRRKLHRGRPAAGGRARSGPGDRTSATSPTR